MLLTTPPISLRELIAGNSRRTSQRVKIGKDIFNFSSLDKVIFPKEGITKLDLMKYYFEMRSYVLPYLKDRPLTLRRYPAGLNGKKFYQHDLDTAPEELTTEMIWSKSDQVEKRFALANDIGDLLYLINIGCIAMHPYLCRIDQLDKPDFVIIDLDPQPKAKFDNVREIALTVKKVLDGYGLKSYAKTSGSTGMHIVVPIQRRYTFAQTSAFGKIVAEETVHLLSKLATTTRLVSTRKPEMVYVDYLQNLYGKSMASAYSIREREEATVSTPVTWAEVKKGFEVENFTIHNIRARVKKRGDLFKPVLTSMQILPQ